MQAKKILQRNPVVVIISKLTMLHGFAKKTIFVAKYGTYTLEKILLKFRRFGRFR